MGQGDHAIRHAGFHGVYPKRTEAEDVSAGVSVDQLVARQIGQETPFPSLELATANTRLHRRMHQRIQLWIHQHHLVELTDHAAADGVQSTRSVRAHVRPSARRNSAAPAGSAT